MWVEPDIREAVVDEMTRMAAVTAVPLRRLLAWLSIAPSKFYQWRQQYGQPPCQGHVVPRSHWLLPQERRAILAYARNHTDEGYRRLTYMMLDAGIVAVSPSSTYRVLREAGLLQRWNTKKSSKKGTGFVQPLGPHEHWHTDIKYVNFHGAFLFLISVIDGFSRFIVHHELRTSMCEYDVQITIERALELHPGVTPRLISDNGAQYIAKDFAEYITQKGLHHVRTSIAYPQSNGKIERFHGSINRECLQQHSFITLDDARKQIAAYIQYYNTQRLHSAIFYLTPAEVLAGSMPQRLQEREERLRSAALLRRQRRMAA